MGQVLASICARTPQAKMAVIGAMGRLILPCHAPEDTQRFYLQVQQLLKSCGLIIWIEDVQPTHIELGLGPPFIADASFFSALEERLHLFIRKLAALDLQELADSKGAL